ncbi:MAG: glycerate kinase [Thermoplasmata archaeon]
MLIRNRGDLVGGPRRPELRDMRHAALQIFEAALESVDPQIAVRRHLKREKGLLSVDGLELELSRVDSVRMIAFGKASLPMARAVSEIIDLDEALVVTDGRASSKNSEFQVVVAGHPHPDEGSLKAGSMALQIARRCGPGDLLLVLVSGGGSAMLEDTDLPLPALREVSDLLIRSGMDIKKLNTVRKHLSNIKGGQLGKVAAVGGGAVVALAVSDVVGDLPSFIASGPTVPDETTFQDAKSVLGDFGLWETIPREARERIEAGIQGTIPETPKPGEAPLEKVRNLIIASIAMACEAAAREASRRGYQSMILTSHIQGEAKEVGRVLASVAVSVYENNQPLKRPVAIIAGGETTVTVTGAGIGGRNQELVLSAAPLLEDRDIVLLSCGTDGQDGPTEAAGALADGETLSRASRLNLDPLVHLFENDSHSFFRRLGDTVITGPTGTNVMDLQIVLVGA